MGVKKMKGPFSEGLFFSEELPSRLFELEHPVWFVDEHFKNLDVLPSGSTCFVQAGERLKTLGFLEEALNYLIKSNASKTQPLVAMGGGSVGDAIGFVASVYLRGVPLIMVPTTWLAAIDSSLGGKTALNIPPYKNQIGSFHSADEVHYVRSLIEESSKEEALGEYYKTLFLNPRALWSKRMISKKEEGLSFENLPHFIKYKSRIVKKDPLDQEGIRAALNLGHTLGHVYELTSELSHSEAVLKGLVFALRWSGHKGLISLSSQERLLEALPERAFEVPDVTLDQMSDLLLKDKKRVSKGCLQYVFLTDDGPLVEEVEIKDIVKEWEKQLEL